MRQSRTSSSGRRVKLKLTVGLVNILTCWDHSNHLLGARLRSEKFLDHTLSGDEHVDDGPYTSFAPLTAVALSQTCRKCCCFVPVLQVH